MGRFRQVTRTVEYTVAQVMVVDTTTQQVDTIEISVSDTYTSKDKLLKEVSKQVSEPLKAVSIVNSTVEEKTFCMPETMFIRDAMPLPIGKKALTQADFEEYYSSKSEEYDEE